MGPRLELNRIGLRALVGLGTIDFVMLQILERRNALLESVWLQQRLERRAPMVEPDLSETSWNHEAIVEMKSGPGEQAR